MTTMFLNPISALIREAEAAKAAKAAGNARRTASVFAVAVRAAFGHDAADGDDMPDAAEAFGNLELIAQDLKSESERLREAFAVAARDGRTEAVIDGFGFAVEWTTGEKAEPKPASKQKPVRRLDDIRTKFERLVKVAEYATDAAYDCLFEPVENSHVDRLRGENDVERRTSEALEVFRVQALSPIRKLLDAADKAEAAAAAAAEAEAEAEAAFKAAKEARVKADARVIEARDAIAAFEAAAAKNAEKAENVDAIVRAAEAEAAAAKADKAKAEAERKAEAKARKAAQDRAAAEAAARLDLEAAAVAAVAAEAAAVAAVAAEAAAVAAAQ